MPKDGRSQGKQTYRCAPDGSRHFHSSKVIARALAMRAEGASAAAIGRAMEINEATVLRHVKKSHFVQPDNSRGAFGAQARRVGYSRVSEEDTGYKLRQARSEVGFVR